MRGSQVMRATANRADTTRTGGATASAGAPMLLWAGEPGAEPPWHPNLVLWGGIAPGEHARTLTQALEAHADLIRGKYLAWAHELGELVIRGRALRDRFVFAPGANLWPQSVFVEQSPWKQRSLETILKLLALELLLDRERPAQLCYVGANRGLHKVLRALCSERRIRYEWQRRRARPDWSARGLLRVLPHPVQGAIQLLRYALTGIAPRAAVAEPPGQGARVLFCGPLFNYEAEATRAEGFRSRFWTVLPDLLSQESAQVRWLHFFYRHEQTPSVRRARRMLARLNQSAAPGGVHYLMNSYLTVAGLGRMLSQWLKVGAESMAVGASLRRRFAHRPRESYWPIIREDWGKAFRGWGCVENLFYAECFDRALQLLPRQDQGIYLMEHQGWERALARAWRRHGHGRLTGVAHATVRYWDLRYHSDPRRYQAPCRPCLPGPDVVALNGRAAREAYCATTAARESLVECEALRYLNLIPRPRQPAPEAGGNRRLSILVLGDYMRASTDAVLRLLERARPDEAEIIVKPHPNCPVHAARFPGLDLRVVDGTVFELASRADVVLAGNLTSAAVEAFVGGARVLVHDDGSAVNYAPLRGVLGVTFVAGVHELRQELTAAAGAAAPRAPAADDFFHVDPALPRWRRYLGLRAAQ